MTREQLLNILNRLGITPDQAAALLGTSQRCVYYWTQGKNPIPRAVAILLTAMAEGALPAAWLAAKLREIPPGLRTRKGASK